MQVLCLATSEVFDVECPTCGQKYALYFAGKSQEERLSAVESVLETLERHHDDGNSATTAHPSTAFNVPEWHGPAHMSGAALLGGAPTLSSVQP